MWVVRPWRLAKVLPQASHFQEFSAEDFGASSSERQLDSFCGGRGTVNINKYEHKLYPLLKEEKQNLKISLITYSNRLRFIAQRSASETDAGAKRQRLLDYTIIRVASAGIHKLVKTELPKRSSGLLFKSLIG